MNAEKLSTELLEFGYTGRLADLIKYSGSIEALLWYWENYLGKVLKKSKRFYGGGFIRFKVREEAYKKYWQFSSKSENQKDYELKKKCRRQSITKKQKKFTETLDKWFINYEKNIDQNQQYNDLNNFIECSGYFNYMNYAQKSKLYSLESPVYFNEVQRTLFYDYKNTMLRFED